MGELTGSVEIMNQTKQEKQIISRKRIADHGEVFTPAWMVGAMLNLAKDETERIDSRFLEPACGSGNFLVQILQRKLAAVEIKFGKSDFEKRHYALLALMCIYGIELLPDNIAECRTVGLDRVQMCNIEAGEVNSTLATIEKIAQALGVSSDELLK